MREQTSLCVASFASLAHPEPFIPLYISLSLSTSFSLSLPLSLGRFMPAGQLMPGKKPGLRGFEGGRRAHHCFAPVRGAFLLSPPYAPATFFYAELLNESSSLLLLARLIFLPNASARLLREI